MFKWFNSWRLNKLKLKLVGETTELAAIRVETQAVGRTNLYYMQREILLATSIAKTKEKLKQLGMVEEKDVNVNQFGSLPTKHEIKLPGYWTHKVIGDIIFISRIVKQGGLNKQPLYTLEGEYGIVDLTLKDLKEEFRPTTVNEYNSYFEDNYAHIT